MTQTYQPLPLHRLESGASYLRPKQKLVGHVAAADPAVGVMTDLGQVTTYITELSKPLGKAQEIMVKRGIRMLLVCDINDQILGLITSRDIMGDKPSRIMAKAGCRWEDLVVADIMTLGSKLEVLLMEHVLNARVGDIIATLRQVNRQHAIVVKSNPITGAQTVCGLFSLSHIGLQLGLNIDPARQPTTYAELEQAGGGI